MLRKHPSNGNSVLHIASSRGHELIVRLLLDTCARCYSNQVCADDESLCPSEGPCCTEVEAFINSFNFQKKTPLMLAAEKGKILSLFIKDMLTFYNVCNYLGFSGKSCIYNI